MRPDGFYWVRKKDRRHRGGPVVAHWWNGRWWFVASTEPVPDGKIEVLAPCILPSDGPQ